jgi:hypothetical protein
VNKAELGNLNENHRKEMRYFCYIQYVVRDKSTKVSVKIFLKLKNVIRKRCF